MPVGLSVSRVVDVDVVFAPVGVPAANLNSLLILGDSDVIDTGEVIRTYNTLAEVTADFLTTSPEYNAAALFFGQTPQPDELFIGRWARTATSGVVVGGDLTSAQQAMALWTSTTNGGFHMSVDGGVSTNFTGINLSGATNLNGVATLIQTAVRASGGAFAAVSVIWTGSHFVIKSGTTGAASTVSYLTAPTAGTDLSGQLKLTAALASRNVAGIIAETPVAGVTRVDGRGWYGLMFAASVMPTDSQRLAVAAYIEGSSDKHLYGITSQDAAVIDPNNSADIASQLSLADYLRTYVQYSTTNAYAVASWFGRALTVNFEGSNTALTMKFKKEPGIVPEILSATQADAIKAKRCNVYAQYNNGASITQEGVMSGLAYFDEIHGTDWLANRIQTDVFNELYQSPKVPQTNAGVHTLVTRCESGLGQGVINGMIGENLRWNAPGFGELKEGDLMAKGWYAFAAKVEDQDQTIREQRIAPLIQIAVKLAGAVHQADVQININR